MKRLIVLAALAAAVLPLTACGGSSDNHASASCMILTEGGNKLCGEDAKVWCNSTDTIREQGIKVATKALDSASAIALTRAQSDCDNIRDISPDAPKVDRGTTIGGPDKDGDGFKKDVDIDDNDRMVH